MNVIRTRHHWSVVATPGSAFGKRVQGLLAQSGSPGIPAPVMHPMNRLTSAESTSSSPSIIARVQPACGGPAPGPVRHAWNRPKSSMSTSLRRAGARTGQARLEPAEVFHVHIVVRVEIARHAADVQEDGDLLAQVGRGGVEHIDRRGMVPVRQHAGVVPDGDRIRFAVGRPLVRQDRQPIRRLGDGIVQGPLSAVAHGEAVVRQRVAGEQAVFEQGRSDLDRRGACAQHEVVPDDISRVDVRVRMRAGRQPRLGDRDGVGLGTTCRRGDLRHDVDAVAVGLDGRQGADLTCTVASSTGWPVASSVMRPHIVPSVAVAGSRHGMAGVATGAVNRLSRT